MVANELELRIAYLQYLYIWYLQFENIKDDVPFGMDEHYNYLKDLYNSLVFLQDASSRVDHLSDQEISEVFGNLVVISMRKDNLLEGK